MLTTPRPDFDEASLPTLSLKAQTPLLLVPVRVQVKFMRNSDEDMQRYNTEHPEVPRYPLELLVRIYPDQLSVARHEAGLTESEVVAGRHYWLQALTSADRANDTPHSLLAWQTLLGRYPANRAYWIVQSTAPEDVEGLSREADVIRDDLAQLEGGFTLHNWPESFLTLLDRRFPDPTTQATAWEQAATAKCLPDRFVVALYNKYADVGQVQDAYIKELLTENQAIRYNPYTGATDRRDVVLNQTKYENELLDLTSEFLELVRTEVGAEISNNELVVGLNGGTNGQEEQLDDEKGLGGDLAWLADFNRAVEVGMGLVIPLEGDEAFARGFDRLVVVGVRAERAAEQEMEALTDLLQGHTYADGLELVPQGTPTNNTNGAGAGYSSAEQFDAEATFRQYWQGPLFERQEPSELFPQQDGQRLATALGVDPTVLEHARHADRRDGQEATLFNQALWPATFGYFSREMLEPILGSTDMTRATYDFFQQYVTGRGPVPAFRVDNVPYGVLPTTWFSQWTPPDQLQGFGETSWDLIRRFDVTWTERLNAFAEYPPDFSRETPFFSAPPSRQDILTVLGQEAASVEFYQRYFIGANTMNTLAHRAEQLNSQQNRNIEVWPPVPQFDTGGTRPITGYVSNPRENLPARFDNVGYGENPLYSTFLNFFDPTNYYQRNVQAWPHTFDVNYQMGYRKVVHTYADETQPQLQSMGGAVDNTLISEANPIQPLIPWSADAVASGQMPDENALRNYINWLADSDFNTIRLEDFRAEFPNFNEPPEGFEAPNSLLYLLLRQAVMWSYWEVAVAILEEQRGIEIPRQEIELFNILTKDDARWQWLYQPLEDGGPLLYEQILELDHPEAQRLREYLETLRSLAGLPTARLERLLAEHLDLGNHRLDAWKTGHVLTRLLEQRRESPGNYLGSFGWLEDVYPQDQSETEDDGRRFDPDNLGYIHAPTINHGVTAAVLRQGYKSRQFETDPTKPEANRMAINLSSERVRRALKLMEGIRTGNSLAAMLGRDFEEGLFNATPANAPSYAQEIEGFRLKYPNSSERVIPGQATSTTSPAQDARQVVNGLDLIKKLPLVLPPKGPSDPFGISINDGPARDDFWEAVRTQVEELRNTLDALGDLTVGESIHQAVGGNVEQGAAILENVAKGKFPPLPDIVHPSRTGVTLTHRVLLHLPQADTAVLNSNWPSARSVLAQAEPGLNNWLAGLMGDARDTVFRYDYQIPGDPPVQASATVSLFNLGLQPIDVLFLVNQEAFQEGSALDAFVAYAILYNTSLPGRPSEPFQLISVDYAAVGLAPLRALMPLLGRIRQLLATSRPASAADLSGPSQQLPGQTTNAEDGVVADGRLTQIYEDLEDAVSTLTTHITAIEALLATSPPPTGLSASLESAYQDLRVALHTVGAYNLPEAYVSTLQAGDDMLGAAKSVLKTIQRRLAAAFDLQTDPAGPEERNAASLYAERAKALLGNNFRLSIIFNLSGSASSVYAQTHSTREQLLRHHDDNPDLLSEWLQGLAPVRDPLNHLEKVYLLNDLLWDNASGHVLPELSPIQLSSRSPSQTEYWLGASYPSPKDGYTPPEDAVSLVQWLPDPASYSATGPQRALVLDEWVETIPREQEDTSLVFHYDQPNTEAPQTLLLAVAPDPRNYPTWDWATVLGVVNESLDFAKKRAVEPANLSFTHLGCILPTIVAPVAQEGVTLNLDFRKLTRDAQFAGKPYLPE